MKVVDVSVIVPAYNDQGRLGKTLKRVHEHLSAQTYSWEVLVVLDGPTDRTPTVARSFEDTFDGKLRVIHYPANRGKGYAVRTGMLAAAGKVRVFTDADNSTDIHYLEDLRAKMDKGCDVVISSRDKKDAAGAGQTVPQVWFKRQLGNMSNLLVQIFVVWGIWDTQNGFKGFSAEAADELFARSRIDRFGFDFEVLAIARRLGYRIGIIPILWENDTKSLVKFSNYFTTLIELLWVRWNLWTGVYKEKRSHEEALS